MAGWRWGDRIQSGSAVCLSMFDLQAEAPVGIKINRIDIPMHPENRCWNFAAYEKAITPKNQIEWWSSYCQHHRPLLLPVKKQIVSPWLILMESKWWWMERMQLVIMSFQLLEF